MQKGKEPRIAVRGRVKVEVEVTSSDRAGLRIKGNVSAWVVKRFYSKKAAAFWCISNHHNSASTDLLTSSSRLLFPY